MHSFTGLFVVLAIIFVATECVFIPYGKRRDSPPRPPEPVRPCHALIDHCTQPLQENSFIGGESNDYRTLITNIDDICVAFQSAKECIQPDLNYCDYRFEQQLEAAISIGDFVCSAHGKSLLREYQNSVCYDDPFKIYELEGAAQFCVSEFVTKYEGTVDRKILCEKSREIAQCVVRLVTNECGEAAGQIVDAVTSILWPAIVESQCSNENTDEYLKRGLDLLKRKVYTD